MKMGYSPATQNRNHRLVLAAVELPPFPASSGSASWDLHSITEHAVQNAAKCARAGVDGILLQNLGDQPVPHVAAMHTVAYMTRVACSVRSEVNVEVGISLLSNDGHAPIAIAHAVGGRYVRFKVYVGATVRAAGVLTGCAHEAVFWRETLRASELRILADITDRVGTPLAPTPVATVARQALGMGKADAVIVTGADEGETLAMLRDLNGGVDRSKVLVGGGADIHNVAELMRDAGGVIVGTSLRQEPREFYSHFDESKLGAFVQIVRATE